MNSYSCVNSEASCTQVHECKTFIESHATAVSISKSMIQLCKSVLCKCCNNVNEVEDDSHSSHISVVTHVNAKL